MDEEDQDLDDEELREQKPQVYYKKLLDRNRTDLPVKKPVLDMTKGYYY